MTRNLKLSMQGKKLEGDIMQIAAKAQAAYKINPNTIDSTIGMLYTEEQKLHTFKAVKKSMEQLADEEMFLYSTASGNDQINDAIQKWILKDKETAIKNITNVKTIATTGATAALNFTIKNYLQDYQHLLISSASWDAYKVMALANYEKAYTYNMFDENNNFDVQDLDAKISQLKESQRNIVLIINDPSHNPTGYSLTMDEWDAVIKVLEKHSSDSHPINLILDTAYLEYAHDPSLHREVYLKLANCNENITTIVAFSASKTFGLYGLRIGGAVVMCKDASKVVDYFDSTEFTARASYGSISQIGASIITKIVNSQELTKIWEDEIKLEKELLFKKAEYLIENAKQANLQVNPYKEGFFITIKTDTPYEDAKKLEKYDIYLIPLDCGLRVALCSLPFDKCENLMVKIANVIN